MRSVRFRILLALCLIIGLSGCSSSSPCNYLLIELTQLGLEPGQPAAGFIEALVRLDGKSWLHTAKAQFPAADKWAFCAPELPAGSHELRVTLLGSRGEEQAYLGAEFNISVPSVMPAPGRITWSEPVTLRRPRLCNEHGWCWENPWPQGSPLLSVQSRDRDSVWAVGDAGTILHFNGGYWQRIPVTYSGVASGLWVDESDHAWILLSPDHIYRCDNLECRKVGAEGSPTFNQIVGFDSEHIFAVGTNGSLYNCDRTRCKQLNSTVGVNLSSAVATASNVVYVAGDAGTVLRCEGDVCIHIGPKTGGAFNAIARDASSAIHVVGEEGRYLICKAGGCAAVATGTTLPLHQIQVFEDGSVLLRGAQATVVACGGGSCRSLDVPKGLMLTGMYGATPNDAWVSGYEILNAADSVNRGLVLRCDGTRCREVYSVPQYNGSLAALHGSDRDSVWAVGYLGVMVQCGDAGGCHARSNGATESFAAMSGDASVIWASGQNGAVVRCVEDQGCTQVSSSTGSWQWGGGGTRDRYWTVGRNGSAAVCTVDGCTELPTGTGQLLTGVFSIDGHSVWVMGGAQLIYRCDENSCTKIQDEQPGNAQAAWGTDINNTWVVGGYQNGVVYRCQGSRCTSIHSDPVAWEFLAVSGASPDGVWAVGQVGGVIRCTTAACTQAPSGLTSRLLDVWVPTPDSALVAGWDGVILWCQGSSCRPVASGTDKYLCSIRGSSLERVYIVGSNGTMLSCSNNRCDRMTMLTPVDLSKVLVPDDKSGWIVGGGGTVLRFYPSRVRGS